MTTRYLKALLVVAFLAQGCSATHPVLEPASQPVAPAAKDPDNVVVLLPDSDGHVGQVLVSNSQGSQELTQAGAATEVAGPQQAPRPPSEMAQDQIMRIFGEALSAQPPVPVHYILYFYFDSTQMTAQSRRLVAEVIRAIRERSSTYVSVDGHSDTVGTRAYNYGLSLRRAQAVRQLILHARIDPSSLEITAHGKDDPIVKTGDGVAEPRNRRVEITVR